MLVKGFGWGFLFGAFLLFQKLMVVVIIGTTVSSSLEVPIGVRVGASGFWLG